MYSVDKNDTLAAFENLRPIWDELVNQSPFPNIFVTFDWLRTWWEVFGQDHQLYILTVRSDEKVIGIAPLMLTRYRRVGLSNSVVRFIGTPNCDYAQFIGPETSVLTEQVLKYLAEHRGDWTRVELAQISSRAISADTLASAAQQLNMRHQVKSLETCMSYVYDGNESDRDTFALTRKRNFRNALHFFNRHEGLTLERYIDSASIKKLLPELFHSHITRWKDTPTPSKFLNPAHRQFYDLLADRLVPHGRVNMVILRHGAKPLGFLWLHPYASTVHLYTVCHQPFYDRKSPGIIVFHFATEEYVRDSYSEIDFARGAGSHKTRFINHESLNYQLTIYNRTIEHLASKIYDGLKGLKFVRNFIKRPAVRRFRARISLVRSEPGGIVGHLFKTVFDYRHDLLLRRERSVTNVGDVPNSITVSQLEERDFEEISSFMGFEEGSFAHQHLQSYFERGGICHTATRSGYPAAMLWALPGGNWTNASGQRISLKENEILLADILTSPIFEPGETEKHLIGEVSEHYVKQRLFPVTLCSKRDAARFHHLKELGFEPISHLRSLKLFGLKIL